MIKLINFRDEVKYPELTFNVTSGANGWTRKLSPFLLGPVEVKLNSDWSAISKNVENAWQFSKVYSNQVDEEGHPTIEWFKWRDEGYRNPVAIRYPMGKGKKPLYSYWQGKKLTYIEARKEIYIPLYLGAVKGTTELEFLKYIYEKEGEIYIKDYDVYDRGNLTWEEIINDPNKKMGHGFVLAMILEGFLK